MIKRINKKIKIKEKIFIPGDKSITHRSIILSGLAQGESVIHNYLKSDDCLRTIEILKQMGVKIICENNNLFVNGVGICGLKQPKNILYCGNSGTTIRLISGVISGQNVYVELTGDESLSKRPMKRIIEPLRLMDVNITAVNDEFPPIKIKGNPQLKPVTYELKIPSAQVKSCILLAGMQAKGETTVIESIQTRDHTERLMDFFKMDIKKQGKKITVKGSVEYKGKEIFIPGDISSASFFIAYGILVSDKPIIIENVGINPTRTGFFDILKKMGADIKIQNEKMINNEPVADIIVKKSQLNSVVINSQDLITRMIDEIPLLCLLATQAKGETVIRGAEELRVKETDRIKAISTELKKLSAEIKELKDGFIIKGPAYLKGAEVNSYNDHRIAMTLAIAGLLTQDDVIINNSECTDISFPDFWNYFYK